MSNLHFPVHPSWGSWHNVESTPTSLTNSNTVLARSFHPSFPGIRGVHDNFFPVSLACLPCSTSDVIQHLLPRNYSLLRVIAECLAMFLSVLCLQKAGILYRNCTTPGKNSAAILALLCHPWVPSRMAYSWMFVCLSAWTLKSAFWSFICTLLESPFLHPWAARLFPELLPREGAVLSPPVTKHRSQAKLNAVSATDQQIDPGR